MAIKYWKYTIRGHHAEGDMHTLLRPLASHGLIVRVHSDKGETTVYVAAEKAPEGKEGKPTEVSVDEVTKIR
jgi:hypothetical protein